MYRLCTICARGGSKGVPNKNLRVIAGLPLLAHTIGQARDSGLFDAIVVSSDSAAILSLAEEHGAGVIQRPDEMAQDRSAKLPAIHHCVRTHEDLAGVRADVIVDLDATSPLRTVDDIAACVRLIEDEGAGNVITASPARRSPYFNMVELDDGNTPRLVKKPASEIGRRQDSPPCYDMNASIYAWSQAAFAAADSIFHDTTRLYVMPEERSVDIDSPLDWLIVELLLEERRAAAADRAGGPGNEHP